MSTAREARAVVAWAHDVRRRGRKRHNFEASGIKGLGLSGFARGDWLHVELWKATYCKPINPEPWTLTPLSPEAPKTKP